MKYLKIFLPKKTKIIMLLGILILFTACENIFEFSAYVANVKENDKNTNAKNLQLIEDIQLESKDFKFAFVTDTHFFYNNLKTVINDINKKEDVLSVILGGVTRCYFGKNESQSQRKSLVHSRLCKNAVCG